MFCQLCISTSFGDLVYFSTLFQIIAKTTKAVSNLLRLCDLDINLARKINEKASKGVDRLESLLALCIIK